MATEVGHADPYAGWSAETWVYAGLRVGAKGARRHAWIEPGGREYHYNDKGSYVVGGQYDVKVDRSSDSVTRTTPRYARSQVDADQRAVYEVKDRAARTELANRARERRDGAQSALDEALGPVLDIAAKLRTAADLDALVTYVTREIYATNWRRSR